jgi:hypothetical protein
MSSRAYLVDLIHSIGEKTALEDHLMEKLPDHPELKDTIKKVADLRRSQMNQLLASGEKPNPDWWCAFKHAVKAWTLDCEVYEATLDKESYDNMVKSSNNLAEMTSLFLGMEFETCARCLYDKLLVKQLEK